LKIISACKIIEKKSKSSLFTEKYKLFLHRETFRNDIKDIFNSIYPADNQ